MSILMLAWMTLTVLLMALTTLLFRKRRPLGFLQATGIMAVALVAACAVANKSVRGSTLSAEEASSWGQIGLQAPTASPTTPAPSSSASASTQASGSASPSPSPSPSATASASPALDGQALYGAHCAACHQIDGSGITGVFPPMAGAAVPNGDPNQHIKIVLDGLSGPTTVKGQSYDGTMPAFKGQLTAAEIAAIVSYERTSWGNTGGAVTASQVTALGG